MKKLAVLCSSGLLFLLCCSAQDDSISETNAAEETVATNPGVASVTQVSVQGNENSYTFNVTISSDDLGCEQYADWWEVLDLDGNLIYRRILAHSHPNEQPFTRGGSSVAISADTEVYIRAHMNNSGYGSNVLKGTVNNGFNNFNLDSDFAEDLETSQPLPQGCAF